MNAVVVIPLYKEEPSEDEMLSLRQCFSVLGNHDIVFLAPEGLSLNKYMDIGSPARVESFDSGYFDSIDDYNRLLRSECFYAAFVKYQYMLIYQLDCYVFRDELLDWCSYGLSYVGPPWLNYDFLKESNNPLKYIPGIGSFLASVGNGGFSLRNVQLHRDLARKYALLSKVMRVNEDLFWCSIVSRLEKKYRLPSVEMALNFAFELEPRWSFKQCNSRLPFGCHAWKKYDAGFWAAHIPVNGVLHADEQCHFCDV
ncbi:DUF5672 family protein [Pontiella agarivorans]|uniref:DUF5672 family protein n=1 Tax=Pontiella agarivorans TaxID=3038953 RepID=A0ABU5MT72_9BACT|nr:DUF5672 family protein [Pontiella agarivorans]MDZ8117332.1 DUF5672 family protein [Pontiella agarivorans]